MIAYLNGKILKKTDKGIILDTGNVGYFVHLTNNTLTECGEKENIELFIHSHIKEDGFDLYGFDSFSKLTFFKEILGVRGIGPKVALEILNAPLDNIKTAIIDEDSAFIATIPGIGKKTAQRLILELKGKVDFADLNRPFKTIETNDDITDALIKFGYSKHQIIRTLRTIPKEITKEEEIISFFLKNIQ